MWLKILGIVTFPSIIAWLTRIFWPKIWTTDVKGQVTCHNYGEKGPGSACHRICPLGYFHLPTMDEQCHPWLTCHDLRNDIVKVKVIGAGAVKKVSVATWKSHMVAMNEPVTELYLKDYRYGLDILKKLQGHLEVIQFIGSCNDVYVTQYHRFGSADQIGNILGDLNSGHKDTMATRFILCLNYVAILNFLHTNTLGTLVMCDSNDLEKTLKQYLITDDLMLVLNDIDSLAKVNHSAGELIKCGHRELGGGFVAPEQLWPYDAEFTDDTMPPYDEKSDIWKIPDVCNNFIIGHRDSMKVKLDLFGIHSACKAGVSKMDETELIESLVKRGFENMKKSLHYEDGRNSPQTGYTRDMAFMAVAKFCDRILRMVEDDELELSKATIKTFPDTVVVCLLNAMRFDSMEAKQRFPRLLQLVEHYPDCMGTFVDKCEEVPCWMYLLWISQMMALMDKPEAPAVQPVLLKIATMYPQAVVYHFKLSQEGFQFGDKPHDKKNKAMVERLANLLNEENVPLVSKFICALEQFGQPDQIFKDWGNDMLRMLKKKKQDKVKIKELYQEMYRQLLEPSQGTLSSQQDDVFSTQTSSQSIIEMGQYLRKFSARFKKDIDKYFGEDGRKLVGMKLKDFFGIFRKLGDDMDHEVRGIPKNPRLIPPASLKEYCKWMVDFNPNTEGNNLEIPGQYTGLTKPLPEYHVKIAGFDQRVLVMSSMRKPKRVVIRGNDEKEYPYLVKGGEDLRQDQRIEQLFFLMNQVFERDPACRQRKLNLRTYQVIPMTPKVGLIEWVSDTMTMKDFLNSSLTDQERNFVHHKTNGPNGQHTAWLQKLGKDLPLAKMYGLMYQKYNKTEAIRELRLKENKIPWDLFRRAFHDISTSPEAFHVLRCTLAVSHALVSICQYILGIGDRHLSNFMINLKTGQMIGIDFGHAFGSATQFLPIPELMPFRLTKQLRNLMLPLQVKGLMESTMVHALRALREDYDLLLATMDIFVKEPSVDWLVNAEKQIQSLNLGDSLEVENITWYPKEKVHYVKRKLKGENPSYITRDELRLGHSKNDFLRNFESVVMGERDDTRAQLPQDSLSVEDQVAALIDQATDPNILGRVYAGWEPWM